MATERRSFVFVTGKVAVVRASRKLSNASLPVALVNDHSRLRKCEPAGPVNNLRCYKVPGTNDDGSDHLTFTKAKPMLIINADYLQILPNTFLFSL